MTSRQEEVYEVLHTIGWELIEQVGGVVKLNFYNDDKLHRRCELFQDGTVIIDGGCRLNFYTEPPIYS